MSDHDSYPATFGYVPDSSQLEGVLAKGSFNRAVVVGGSVSDLVDRQLECRWLKEPVGDLPRGIYWFLGLDAPLVMQVLDGMPKGGAREIDTRDVSDGDVLRYAWRWGEDIWSLAEKVPPPRFAIHDRALTSRDKQAMIIERSYSGAWMYSVFTDGKYQRIQQDSLLPLQDDDGPEQWVLREPASAARFAATLTRAKLDGRFSDTLFSFRATKTVFRPYQFKPVLKLLQTGKARLLVADEVGLGKTIEAGLIWTELEARHEADRVLVVCPSNLVSKWQNEMEERFGFETKELHGSELRNYLTRQQEGRLPLRHAYVASMENLRSWKGLEELDQTPPEFDLIIVDEAHSMRNTDTKTYALGTRLSDWADHLVFLTATPINLRQEDLLSLLELLAPEDYGDIDGLRLRLEPNAVINAALKMLGRKEATPHGIRAILAQLGESQFGVVMMARPEYGLLEELLRQPTLTRRDKVVAKRHLAELNTLSSVITRTKKVDVDDRQPKRKEDRKNIEWTTSESAFYHQYFAWCQARARKSGQPLHFSMQMPLRLASACLPMAAQQVLSGPNGQIADEDIPVRPRSRTWITPPDGLVKLARALRDEKDTKFETLFEALTGLHRQGKRALLFTFSKPTLEYLRSRLASHFSVAVLHGGVKKIERREIMADFRSGRYDFVLANRVASEGLDFEFCSAVINYDLPWNPMEIEQRIGRIDRIGQREESILIVNFVNSESIDERILVRLLDRIKIFEESIGVLEPIIAQQAEEALKSGFDFTLTEGERDQRLHEAELAIEEQLQGLQDLTDASGALFVTDDVDVAGLEEQLVDEGRYLGQLELVQLIDDWIQVEGARPIQRSSDGCVGTLRGTSTMARRVQDISLDGRVLRGPHEIEAVATDLRNESVITLSLDQEHARSSGTTLLTATHPLVLAACRVPATQQARYATVRIPASGEAVEGRYFLLLARAVSSERRGDELWGAAISMDTGKEADAVPLAVLAALARAEFVDEAASGPHDDLSHFVRKAMHSLDMRQVAEQDRREKVFFATKESRRTTLEQQRDRHVATIRRRIQTAEDRGRSQKSINLFRAQIDRANKRFEQTISGLDAASSPEVRIEPLAVCQVQVTNAG